MNAVHGIPGKWILDAELVYINPETGREEFTGSQRRCSTQYPSDYFIGQLPLKLEVFDLLMLNGVNLEHEPYYTRKDKLVKLWAYGADDSSIEFVPYESNLTAAWNLALEQDLEGLIIKQTQSAYEHDRSYNWLKVKNWKYEVCDIAGWTPGTGARSSFFGSLVLEKNGHFLGKAGSGFDEWELRKFKDLFSDAPRIPQAYSIDEPYTAAKVDAQVLVKYYQVTESGVLRFPIFISSS